MKLPRPHRLDEIAALLQCTWVGPDDFQVLGFNEIHMVEPGDIVFVDHPKYYDKALQSAATIVLINKQVDPPAGKALLISDDPFRDFNALTKHFNPFVPYRAAIDPGATIGQGTHIAPGAVIGHNVVIGNDCVIHPNVVIYPGARIGNRVIIHANTTIGADAFYYKKRPEGFDRLLSAGNVVLEDDVEIGAQCTIDRGVSAATRIGKGSKLDNQVHIGHDTNVGEKCLFASQVGIAGCVVIEDEVTLWGQVGCASGVTIGKKAVVQAQSGISKSLEGGKIYFGYPAEEMRRTLRELASIRQLPEFLDEYRKRS
jgi:UDP-3-O-[3-hydroxymyristoyl] glucosamine N-acyltransferase